MRSRVVFSVSASSQEERQGSPEKVPTRWPSPVWMTHDHLETSPLWVKREASSQKCVLRCVGHGHGRPTAGRCGSGFRSQGASAILEALVEVAIPEPSKARGFSEWLHSPRRMQSAALRTSFRFGPSPSPRVDRMRASSRAARARRRSRRCSGSTSRPGGQDNGAGLAHRRQRGRPRALVRRNLALAYDGHDAPAVEPE